MLINLHKIKFCIFRWITFIIEDINDFKGLTIESFSFIFLKKWI